jgi:ferredoxin
MSTPATVRHHVLTNLDHYLTELEEQLTAKGGKVVYLRSAEEVADSIELLAREKGWSLPADLRQQIERLEPGVAEYLQGGPREAPGSLLLAAGELRIASAAYLIAEAGAVCLIGPPADGAGPRMQIVVAGIDRVLPRMRDVAVFLPLLAGEGSVQFLTGPRRAGEWDGPEELYIYLVDGGRIPLLADPAKRDLLRCVRCGACLSSPPDGSPVVCPVGIDLENIPGLLRRELPAETSGWKYRLWGFVMRRPRLYEFAGRMLRSFWREEWGVPEPPAKSFRQMWREEGRK